MWVARNRNGNLYLFEVKPKRSIEDEVWFTETKYDNEMLINSSSFIDLKWEDEPIEVYLKPVDKNNFHIKNETINNLRKILYNV